MQAMNYPGGRDICTCRYPCKAYVHRHILTSGAAQFGRATVLWAQCVDFVVVRDAVAAGEAPAKGICDRRKTKEARIWARGGVNAPADGDSD